MKHGVYTVYDKVAKLAGPVFQAVNDGIACRNVVHMLERVKEYDRPAFQLFKIAEFDDEKCDIISCHEVIDVDFPDFSQVKTREFSFEREEE